MKDKDESQVQDVEISQVSDGRRQGSRNPCYALAGAGYAWHSSAIAGAREAGSQF